MRPKRLETKTIIFSVLCECTKTIIFWLFVMRHKRTAEYSHYLIHFYKTFFPSSDIYSGQKINDVYFCASYLYFFFCYYAYILYIIRHVGKFLHDGFLFLWLKKIQDGRKKYLYGVDFFRRSALVRVHSTPSGRLRRISNSVHVLTEQFVDRAGAGCLCIELVRFFSRESLVFVTNIFYRANFHIF